MSAVVAASRYMRAPATLWRDTGVHVVVMPPKEESEVTVLGGGSVLVWRALDAPLTVPEIEERLREAAVAPEDPHAVTACVEDLLTRGLVAWLVEEDEL